MNLLNNIKPFLLGILIASFFLTACKSSSDKARLTEEDYYRIGNDASNEVFKALSGELSKQMAVSKANAISYCNANALTLTDSISKTLNLKVKRTSLRLRNLKNAPSEIENETLMNFDGSSITKPAKPVLVEHDGNMYFFKPIYTMAACLNCHAKNDEIGEDFYHNYIKPNYPNDKAIGFSEGELRGMWSIKF